MLVGLVVCVAARQPARVRVAVLRAATVGLVVLPAVSIGAWTLDRPNLRTVRLASPPPKLACAFHSAVARLLTRCGGAWQDCWDQGCAAPPEHSDADNRLADGSQPPSASRPGCVWIQGAGRSARGRVRASVRIPAHVVHSSSPDRRNLDQRHLDRRRSHHRRHDGIASARPRRSSRVDGAGRPGASKRNEREAAEVAQGNAGWSVHGPYLLGNPQLFDLAARAFAEMGGRAHTHSPNA